MSEKIITITDNGHNSLYMQSQVTRRGKTFSRRVQQSDKIDVKFKADLLCSFKVLKFAFFREEGSLSCLRVRTEENLAMSECRCNHFGKLSPLVTKNLAGDILTIR